VPDSKIGIHQLNGAKFGSRLYNPNNCQVGQQGIGYCGVTYLNLYRFQNIIKEAIVKAKVFALAKGNLIVGLAFGISKQSCLLRNIFDIQPRYLFEGCNFLISITRAYVLHNGTSAARVSDNLHRTAPHPGLDLPYA